MKDAEREVGAASGDLPVVGFDESGHTGADLFHPEQSIFAYGSVLMSETAARELLRDHEVAGRELKTSSLTKSGAGRARLVALLADPRLEGCVKTAIGYKPYWVCAKLVSLVVDEVAAETGTALEEDPHFVRGLATRIYETARSVDGKSFREPYASLMREFAALVRGQATASVGVMAILATQCAERAADPDVRDAYLAAASGAQHVSRWAREDLGPHAGLLAQLLISWEDEVGPFRALHDESAEVREYGPKLRALQASPRRQYARQVSGVRYGYVGGTGVELADSRDHALLQVADAIAGATRLIFNAGIHGYSERQAGFLNNLVATPLPDWLYSVVAADVTIRRAQRKFGKLSKLV